jgi:hypothetical protein
MSPFGHPRRRRHKSGPTDANPSRPRDDGSGTPKPEIWWPKPSMMNVLNSPPTGGAAVKLSIAVKVPGLSVMTLPDVTPGREPNR